MEDIKNIKQKTRSELQGFIIHKACKETKVYDGKYITVDKEFGNIINETDSDLDTIEISTSRFIESSIDEYENDLIVFDNNKSNFIKLYPYSTTKLQQVLNNSEFVTLFRMADYICFNDYVLRNNADTRCRAFSISSLSEILEIPLETFRKMISKYKKYDIIKVHNIGSHGNKEKWITINPYVFGKGKYVKRWVIAEYQDTDWNINEYYGYSNSYFRFIEK